MKGRSSPILVVILIALIHLSLAANVGVSPANINFKNVLRGGYAERPITITIDSEIKTTIEVETYGNTSNWIKFVSKSLTVSKGHPLQLIVSVNPPSDIPNGNYTGFLRIKSSKLTNSIKGHATGIVIPTLDVHITTEITDKEILNCRATNFKISNTEQGDEIILRLDIKNKGNTKISPKISLDIWDQSSTNLLKKETLYPAKIIPTQKGEFIFKLSSKKLPLGQYWVDIAVPDCHSSETLTFDILMEGALYASGKLQKIIIEPWAEIGDIVPILINFKNTGEKSLNAKFMGKVLYQNKIIQLIESDEALFVPINEQDNFQFYFTPQTAGRYVIYGRVFYDNKRTYEQSAILNVMPPSSIKIFLKTLSYITLILIISLLIYKIRKERRSYLNLKLKK